MNLALLGTPNCGKSTLFQLLTGVHTVTGNRPGVTVSVSSAPIKNLSATLFDLPGIRQIPPSSQDEIATFSFLSSTPPDILLIVIDATNPSTVFPLLESLEQAPYRFSKVLFVFNCCDRLIRFPTTQELKQILPFPSIAISAKTGQGLSLLNQKIQWLMKAEFSPVLFSEDLEKVFFDFFQSLIPKPKKVELVLDWIFSKKRIGIPLFFVLTILILLFTFGPPGNFLTDIFCNFFLIPISSLLQTLLAKAPLWLYSLCIEGILGGMASVLSFLPRICLLFLFQTVLEQSGLLSRIALLFDDFFTHFGLRGDAIAPLLLGFGCTVPAIECTKSMKDAPAAFRCSLCLPSVLCSARIPMILFLCDLYFQKYTVWICLSIWILSACFFLLFAKMLSAFQMVTSVKKHADALPRWEMPTVFDLISAVVEELKSFLTRVGGTIFLCSLLIWMLSHFQFGYAGVLSIENSLLANFGRAISPLFSPLGFSNWQVICALLCGIGAKEATLSTLAVLVGGLSNLSKTLFTQASALSFIAFYSFYFPCLATLSEIKNQKAEKKKRLCFLLLPLLFSYFFSFLIYRLSLLLL